MPFPVFLTTFIIFVIVLNIQLRKSKAFKDVMREYLDEETNSNLSPRRNIGAENFVKPDLSRLPIRDDPSSYGNERLAIKQERVVKRANAQMIKFQTPRVNRELKSEFGIENFNKIVEYEENFNIFIRSIIDWADSLIKHEHYAEAEQALLESIRLGSDYMKNFTLLADLYAKTTPEKLEAFAREIEGLNSFASPHTKEKALEYITELKY